MTSTAVASTSDQSVFPQQCSPASAPSRCTAATALSIAAMTFSHGTFTKAEPNEHR